MLNEIHQKTPIRIVATIPCFNNERSIAHFVKTTKEYADDVIVIDDGSE
jgi:glycosyltransferase involved in cell wall biosynthesis